MELEIDRTHSEVSHRMQTLEDLEGDVGDVVMFSQQKKRSTASGPFDVSDFWGFLDSVEVGFIGNGIALVWLPSPATQVPRAFNGFQWLSRL